MSRNRRRRMMKVAAEEMRIKPSCCFPNELRGSLEGQLPGMMPHKENRSDALSPQSHMMNDANTRTTHRSSPPQPPGGALNGGDKILIM